jgi:hypothetical protein
MKVYEGDNMTRQEAMLIIEKEKLQGYNFGGEKIRANEVGIQRNHNKWRVYYTDEKAYLNDIAEYEIESEAIQNLIECLRLNKRLENRRKRKNNF